MKDFCYFILPTILFLLIISCSKSEQALVNYDTNANESYSAQNKVSELMVRSFLEGRRPLTKTGTPADYSIQPYNSASGETLMYIVNYCGGEGWVILSSDVRTPAVLAEGESGSFDKNAGDGSVALWLELLSDNMQRIRESTDEELAFSVEDIEINKSVWGVARESTRDDPKIGHWETTTTTYIEDLDIIEHMTPKWDQDIPYNQYCPYQYPGNDRTVAGCVAVAGAGVLYYLHSLFGLPEEMVSQGYCNGNIYNYTNNEAFIDENSDVWEEMQTEYVDTLVYCDLPEALMIGYIGRQANMNYCNDYSWAIPTNLISGVFEPYGYSCTSGNYDEDIVKESLCDSIPVIVTASDLIIPVNGRIHTFIIDGYRKVRTVYCTRHYWVGDGEPFIPGPKSPGHDYDYYTYSYSAPFIYAIKINWGWWTQWDPVEPINDGWYTLTAGWVVTNGNKTYTYNHYVSMIYGFEVAGLN